MEVILLDPHAAVVCIDGRLYFIAPVVVSALAEPLSVRFIRDDSEMVYIVPGQIPKPKKPCRLCPANAKGCVHAAAVVALGLMKEKASAK